MKLKKNDIVLVISGKDKWKKGKILRVLPEKNKIMVEGVFIVKKHTRPRRSGERGQRIEIPGFIDASNVKLMCPKCGKPARIGYRLTDAGKYRACKKCGQEI